MILAKLLTPKSEPGGMDKNPRALIKSATEVRKYIYGEMTVGGTILFKTKKGDLQYYVVALCSHEVESIGKVFINEGESTDEKYDRSYLAYYLIANISGYHKRVLIHFII
jgi:hypothetical protein